MSSIAWPQYSGFKAGNFSLAVRFLLRPKHLLSFLSIAGLLAIYIAGLYIRIPGLLPDPAPAGQKWWFVTFLDLLFTGGALGRGCLFAMGMLAPMILRRDLYLRAANPIVKMGTNVLSLFIAAALIVWILRSHGVVGHAAGPFFATLFWVILGAVALKLINSRMIALRGPSPLYVNLFLVLFLDLRAVFANLARAHLFGQLAVAAAGVIFVAGCGYFLLNSRVAIKVESIKSAATRRFATLEFAAVDEELLDGISNLCIGLYVCFAALVSLAYGWRSLTESNYPVLICISVLAFALVWAIVATAIQIPNLSQMVAGPGLFGFTSPRDYAVRLMNNFWLIPGRLAGPETEAEIKSRMSAALKRSFFVLAACFAVAVTLHYGVSRATPGMLLFQFGPLTFIFIVLMLVGNLSMIVKHASLGVSQYKQLRRGHSRLADEVYLLGSPEKSSSLSLKSEGQYWDDARTSQQLREMLDYVKLVTEVQQPNAEFRLKQKQRGQGTALELEIVSNAKPKRRWLLYLMSMLQRVVAGVVISFLAVVLCILFFPHLEPKELVEIVAPILVSTAIAPEMVMRLMNRKVKKAA